MALVVLVEAAPSIAATGTARPVRLAGGGERPYVGYRGFADWRSGIMAPPRFSTLIGFDKAGWTGGAIPQTGTIRFGSHDQALLSDLANLYWDGSRVEVRSGDDTFGAPAFGVEMVGTVAAVQYGDGFIDITVSDLSGDLAKPIAPDSFAGTGGLEGGEEATGRIKRRSWGPVFNVEGRLLDKAYSIFEFGDPGRPVQSFTMLKDKGRAGPMTVLAWQGSAAATLQALRDAVAPDGGGVVAPSIVCAKWFTTPAGPLTADLEGETANGYTSDPVGVASRIVAARAPTVSPVFEVDVAAARGACGIHCDNGQETIGDALDRLLLPVSLVWALSPAGTIAVREWKWTDPVELLRSDTVAREVVYPPLLSRKLGFQGNHRIHSDAEISVVLLVTGDGSATYADGTPIDVLRPAQAGADKTATNVASGIFGQAPAATDLTIQPGATNDIGDDTRNDNFSPSYYRANWLRRLRSEFKLLSTVGVSGVGSYGTLESYAAWPDSSGGPVWQRMTIHASGVKLIRFSVTSTPESWGVWAVDYGENRKPGFGADIVESVGGALAILSAFKTILGNAAGFQGQGALATLNALANGSQYLTGFGGLSSASFIRLGGPSGTTFAGILDESGNNYQTNATLITSLGTAAAILGQSGFATSAGLNRDQLFSGGFFAVNAFSLNHTVTRADGSSVVTEALSITSLGIAAAISGQGTLATKDKAASDDLLIASLASARIPASTTGLFQLNSPGTLIIPDIDVQIPGVRTADNDRGEVIVMFLNMAVTLTPSGNGEMTGDSGGRLIITYPNGQVASRILPTGDVSGTSLIIPVPANVGMGVYRIRIELFRGDTAYQDPPDADGTPGRVYRSPNVSLNAPSISGKWRFI